MLKVRREVEDIYKLKEIKSPRTAFDGEHYFESEFFCEFCNAKLTRLVNEIYISDFNLIYCPECGAKIRE